MILNMTLEMSSIYAFFQMFLPIQGKRTKKGQSRGAFIGEGASLILKNR